MLTLPKQPARQSARDAESGIRDSMWGLLLVIILGGIYGGVFTPTEAAAVAAVYAFFIAVFVYRDIGVRQVPHVLLEGRQGDRDADVHRRQRAAVRARADDRAHSADDRRAIIGWGMADWQFLIVVNILLLVAGMFMEPTGIILILAPILFPIAMQLGIDPVHLGIIMVVNLEIGMITPPIGLNLFVTAGITKMSIMQVVRAALPWLMVLLGNVPGARHLRAGDHAVPAEPAVLHHGGADHELVQAVGQRDAAGAIDHERARHGEQAQARARLEQHAPVLRRGGRVDRHAALAQRFPHDQRHPADEAREERGPLEPRQLAVVHEQGRHQGNGDGHREVAPHGVARTADRRDRQRHAEDQRDVDDVRAERIAQGDVGSPGERGVDRDGQFGARRGERRDRDRHDAGGDPRPPRDADCPAHEELAAQCRAGDAGQQGDVALHCSSLAGAFDASGAAPPSGAGPRHSNAAGT
jgi:hypothetical protein